jgi:tetratricopeptide (TPR) repeat protein
MENPAPVINKQELMANALMKEAGEKASQMNFDDAIETYQKAIFLTQDDYLKSIIYHNIGYALLCKGDFEKGIPFFQKALIINPKAGYANENLSFAFIMLGDTDTGKYYHSLAAQTGKIIKAYSYRNLAMYHQKRGEMEKARQNFQKAFEHITIPVDWLEYLYAHFLFEQGEKEEALVYLQMAVEKGEPQAIQWMNEINKSL